MMIDVKRFYYTLFEVHSKFHLSYKKPSFLKKATKNKEYKDFVNVQCTTMKYEIIRKSMVLK